MAQAKVRGGAVGAVNSVPVNVKVSVCPAEPVVFVTFTAADVTSDTGLCASVAPRTLILKSVVVTSNRVVLQ
jgi:hypothetical protein